MCEADLGGRTIGAPGRGARRWWALAAAAAVCAALASAPCQAGPGYAVGLNSSLSGGKVPLNVTFTLILFTERGGRIAAAALDFGDGSPAARVNYGGGQAPRPVRHTYRGPGRFDAVLTITTADGETMSTRQTIAASGGARDNWPRSTPSTAWRRGSDTTRRVSRPGTSISASAGRARHTTRPR